jgi:hypothetical protein
MTREEVRDKVWGAQNLQDLMDILNDLCGNEEDEGKVDLKNLPVFGGASGLNLDYAWSWDDDYRLVPDLTGSNGPAFVKIIERDD